MVGVSSSLFSRLVRIVTLPDKMQVVILQRSAEPLVAAPVRQFAGPNEINSSWQTGFNVRRAEQARQKNQPMKAAAHGGAKNHGAVTALVGVSSSNVTVESREPLCSTLSPKLQNPISNLR